MNISAFSSSLVKIQPKPTTTNTDASSASETKNSVEPTPAASNEVNVKTSKLNENFDIGFRGDSLQQLSTGVLPPYRPKSPPESLKAYFAFSNAEYHCCLECGDTFFLKSSLNFHHNRRSVLIKFPCETCKSIVVFYNRCKLLSHIQSHTDKNEPSDISKAVVSPIPRVLMDGLQSEVLSTLDDELNVMVEMTDKPPSELLEFSLKEGVNEIIEKEQAIVSNNNKKFKCSECNEEFPSFKARVQHLTHNDSIPVLNFHCSKCGMVCPSKCHLKAHQRLHLQVSPYVCPECGDSPDAYWSNFQHHVKYQCFHNARSVGYKCPACDNRVFPNNESLLKHMQFHTEKYLKCGACANAFVSAEVFQEHFLKNHSDTKLRCSTIYKCTICDIAFPGVEQMLLHRSAHLKQQCHEYVFNCMQCEKSLESKIALKAHLKAAHLKIYQQIMKIEVSETKTVEDTSSNYSGKVECMLCNSVFNSYRGYIFHLAKLHINHNQPCCYCFMIISNRKEMIAHGKKHLNKNNLVCLLCNNKKCLDPKNLEAHLCKHIDKLQHCSACVICNTLLETWEEALTHLLDEHNISPSDLTGKSSTGGKANSNTVTCHFCRISFDHEAELQAHLKHKHNIGGPSNQDKSLEQDEPDTKKQCIEGNICAKCEFQSEDRDAFKKHLLTHKTNKNTFQCLECGMCFVVETSLAKHLRIEHKIIDPKKYIEEEGTNFLPDLEKATDVVACDSLICSVCFTTFPTESSLKTHMRSHGMAFIQANKTVTN